MDKLSELKYLSHTLEVIDKEIDISEKFIKGQYDEIKGTNRAYASDVPVLNGGADFDQIVEIYRYNDAVYHEEKKYYDKVRWLSVLKKMRESAYFGRIDFCEDGERYCDTYYIGINTLRDDKGDFTVLDWRAPVCSLYYEYEVGNAGYECPAGRIDGVLTVKRQYGITRDNIDYVFDTDVVIEDELLCRLLSESKDNTMGTIVSSIQREQNIAIRYNDNKTLFIFGPAGSGKTSIAMHRAAYMLYKYRDTVSSENMLIFSPNSVFVDYISGVLPELGENNVIIRTPLEMIKEMLPEFTVIYEMSERMESVMRGDERAEQRARQASFKNSRVFLDVVRCYVDYIGKNGIEFKDFYYRNELLMSAQEMKKLYLEDWSDMNYAQRLKRISSRIRAKLDVYIELKKKELTEENAGLFDWEIAENVSRGLSSEFSGIKEEIDRLFAVDTRRIYCDMYLTKDFFDSLNIDMPFEEWKDMISPGAIFNGRLLWDDFFPYVYLKAAITGARLKESEDIMFVFVDEFQDLPPVALAAMEMLFPKATMTFVGDSNQTIDGTGFIYGGENVRGIFTKRDVDVLNLTKSYRFTKEIAEYCSSIIDCPGIEYMDRHGDKVHLEKAGSLVSRVESVAKKINSLKEAGLSSMAVICRNSNTAQRVSDMLSQKGVPVTLVKENQNTFVRGISVVPSYLSKGLEYDAVFVIDADKYSFESERKLYYTVCTRALHTLYVYGEPTIRKVIRNK